MILVTRLNGSQFYVNAELVQVVEATPDTILKLTTGVTMVVREPAELIVGRILGYRQQIHSPLPLQPVEKLS